MSSRDTMIPAAMEATSSKDHPVLPTGAGTPVLHQPLAQVAAVLLVAEDLQGTTKVKARDDPLPPPLLPIMTITTIPIMAMMISWDQVMPPLAAALEQLNTTKQQHMILAITTTLLVAMTRVEMWDMEHQQQEAAMDQQLQAAMMHMAAMTLGAMLAAAMVGAMSGEATMLVVAVVVEAALDGGEVAGVDSAKTTHPKLTTQMVTVHLQVLGVLLN
jgi:hypothetical protein